MQSHIKPLLSIALVTQLLLGCSAMVKTPYQAPTLDVPTEFSNRNHQGLQAAAYADQWWMLFQDQQLNQLVQRVIDRNADLAIAGINLQQAWLRAGLATDKQGIRVGNASVGLGHQFELDGSGHRDTGINIGYPQLSYEIDLFGKLANQTEAAKWSAIATEADLQATAQTMIATTATLYWQLGYYHESDATARQSLATTERLYQLVKNQYNNGAVSGLDLAQAAQSVQSQKASLSQIQQRLVQTRTALAVLLQIPVQQLNIQEPERLPKATLPVIAAGLPAEILSRRPDLRSAELRLREALSNKDAVKASYYPSISLTGSLSTGVGIGSSTSLTNVLKNPVATLGAGLTLPFLQYNDMKKNISISNLDYEKAIVQYRKTLYQAFADTENALSAQNELAIQVAAQQRNLDLAVKTEYLTEVRYKNGAIPLKNLLDAQTTTRNVRLSLVELKQSQYSAYVTLMQALGGSPITQLPQAVS